MLVGMDAETERTLERLARTQHGALSRRQAFDAGMTKRSIESWTARGRLLRLDAGVYAFPGNKPTGKRQLKAAELGVPGAKVSGLSGAALLGFPDFRPGRVELTAPRTTRATSGLAVVRYR